MIKNKKNLYSTLFISSSILSVILCTPKTSYASINKPKTLQFPTPKQIKNLGAKDQNEAKSLFSKFKVTINKRKSNTNSKLPTKSLIPNILESSSHLLDSDMAKKLLDEATEPTLTSQNISEFFEGIKNNSTPSTSGLINKDKVILPTPKRSDKKLNAELNEVLFSNTPEEDSSNTGNPLSREFLNFLLEDALELEKKLNSLEIQLENESSSPPSNVENTHSLAASYLSLLKKKGKKTFKTKHLIENTNLLNEDSIQSIKKNKGPLNSLLNQVLNVENYFDNFKEKTSLINKDGILNQILEESLDLENSINFNSQNKETHYGKNKYDILEEIITETKNLQPVYKRTINSLNRSDLMIVDDKNKIIPIGLSELLDEGTDIYPPYPLLPLNPENNTNSLYNFNIPKTKKRKSIYLNVDSDLPSDEKITPQFITSSSSFNKPTSNSTPESDEGVKKLKLYLESKNPKNDPNTNIIDPNRDLNPLNLSWEEIQVKTLNLLPLKENKNDT